MPVLLDQNQQQNNFMIVRPSKKGEETKQKRKTCLMFLPASFFEDCTIFTLFCKFLVMT